MKASFGCGRGGQEERGLSCPLLRGGYSSAPLTLVGMTHVRLRDSSAKFGHRVDLTYSCTEDLVQPSL